MTLRGLGLRRWYSDSVAPTSAEDAAAGFRLGDHWVDTVTNTAYVLVDASAGTWTALGAGGGGAVSSVFGRTGAVVAVGTDYAAHYEALGAVAAHAAAANPHPVYLTQAEGDAAYEALGAVAAHAAAANPHPVYLTQAEGDAAYEPLGGGGGAMTHPKVMTRLAFGGF